MDIFMGGVEEEVAIPKIRTNPPRLSPDRDEVQKAVELLGHVALESMPHPTQKERIVALFQWLDQSEGNASMARIRGAAIVRFGVMTAAR